MHQKIRNFESKVLKMQEIIKDTFFTCTYLPCHHELEKNETYSGQKAEVMVTHPNLHYVDIQTIS